MTLRRAFAPLLGERPRLLILGSLPGEESLRQQQYYAHPRNAFWPIMAALFDFDAALDYPQRVQALTANGVAVWDVLAAGRRKGSLDVAIESRDLQINDFADLFDRQPRLRTVIFNGARAEQEFRRRVLPGLSVSLVCERLPSTSPAMASLRFEQKLAAWQRLRVLLDQSPAGCG